MYGNSEEFEVKFEVHQGLVLSLLLFDGGVDPRGQRWAAVEAVVQYQYVNNLVLMAESRAIKIACPTS